MWRIAREVGLDENSPYKYLLFCRDFAQTSVIAVQNREPVGFATCYLRPDEEDTLFVWQIGVRDSARGLGVAGGMLAHLHERLPQVRYVEASVTPDNVASSRLFTGFAQKWAAGSCALTTLFDESQFPQPHAPELLFRIGPLRDGARTSERLVAPGAGRGGAHRST